MSAKATGLVWDLPCPATINGIQFRPSHKYTLIAYADHADHNGKSIFPSVPTISRKTGLDDRTIQRITKDLESMGYLIDDGQGPRGTNRWKLPYNDRGDTLTPRQGDGVTPSPIPSGDIPSGDIPSGDTVTPESGEPLTNLNIDNELLNIFLKAADSVFSDPRKSSTLQEVRSELARSRIERVDNLFTVSGLPGDRPGYYQEWYRSSFERAFIGLLGEEVSINFTGAGDGN